jgi:predicted HAD superfamily Cof-like phosphohydrolase
MTATIELVSEFHRAFGRHIPDTPELRGPTSNDWLLEHSALQLQALRGLLRRFADGDWRVQRIALIAEELGELATALHRRSLEGALDALEDLDYVVAGGLLDFGFGDVANEARERVHRSNMSKLGADGLPIVDSAGKIVKGPNYVKVHLHDLVNVKDGEE